MTDFEKLLIKELQTRNENLSTLINIMKTISKYIEKPTVEEQTRRVDLFSNFLYEYSIDHFLEAAEAYNAQQKSQEHP